MQFPCQLTLVEMSCLDNLNQQALNVLVLILFLIFFFFFPQEIILMAAKHSGGYLEFILPTKLIHHASVLLLWAVLCLGVFIRF